MSHFEDNFILALNKIVADELKYIGKAKGTSYWYYTGTIGRISVCYTKAKTHYNGKFGFWSWLQTKYTNGKIKRTKFAKSGSRAKAKARAERLFDQLKSKEQQKNEKRN